MTDYIPPSVWSNPDEIGGAFGSINQPTAGSRFEKKLPEGRHSFQLYSMGTPNGVKITIMFEELLAAGFSQAEYDAFYVSIMDGDQFGSGFVEVNPNSKIPALIDKSGDTPIFLFESGAILLHLAERFDYLLPKDKVKRAQTLNWLFWQMGSAPYLGGGFGHFYHYAPVKIEYAINRFTMEVKRQLDLLNKQLEHNQYIAGNDYTIADIAIFPWYGALVKTNPYNSAEFISAREYTHVIRWADEMLKREPVLRGRLVNVSPSEEEPNKLKERHAASDFDGIDIHGV